jgi:hypothetical protein
MPKKNTVMDYNRLVSVTGLGGLYELLSSKADGGVVKSLEDKSAKFVSTRLHNFSHLESIEVFTVKDNVNLVEVFTAMKSSTEKLPDAKADTKAIKAYFEKVYPDMDFERVYNSDMKKMVKWFDLLGCSRTRSGNTQSKSKRNQTGKRKKCTAKKNKFAKKDGLT